MRKQTIKHTLIGAVVTLSLSTLLTGCNKAISEPAEPLIKPVKFLLLKILRLTTLTLFLRVLMQRIERSCLFKLVGKLKSYW